VLNLAFTNDADLPVVTFETSSGAERIPLVGDRCGELAPATLVAAVKA
jgi:hypothetical protein